MHILFFGTSCFAVPALQSLLDSRDHTIVGVVTQPDRPHGRGGKVAMSPVKDAALAAGLPVYQPEKVRSKEFVATARQISPDVLVVAAFGQIIPERLLAMPRFGGINLHGSLLPRWRGAAPMQYALMAGDGETGVTSMQMDAGLDTGDILLKESMPLADSDNLETVERKLSEIGGILILRTLSLLESGTCPRTPQDPEQVTHAPSLPPDVGAIHWSNPAMQIHNLVRGVTPKPGAFTIWQNKRLKLIRTQIANHGTESPASSPGSILSVDTHGITVAAGEGAVRLVEVQPESKPRMDAAAWARGARLISGDRFTEPI